MQIERINSVRSLTDSARLNKTGMNNSALIKESIRGNDEFVSFTGSKDLPISEISRQLRLYGIASDFKDKKFAANCVHKIFKAYHLLFGTNSEPRAITFKPLGRGILGVFNHIDDRISFNSKSNRFNNRFRLNLNSALNWRPIIPNNTSTLHPAHVFAHEFAHKVHWEHLCDRHGKYEAHDFWEGLVGTTVPSAVGRLISRYKLGNYAVDSMDMAEFVAERISKDVCNSLVPISWEFYKIPDVKYDSIFQREWKYRYTSPQSYIDYFTQQIWNGDREGALSVAADIETFLATVEKSKVVDKKGILDLKTELKKSPSILPDLIHEYNTTLTTVAEIKTASKVHPVLEKVLVEADPPKAKTETSTETKGGSLLTAFSDLIRDYNIKSTTELDRINRIDLRPQLRLK